MTMGQVGAADATTARLAVVGSIVAEETEVPAEEPVEPEAPAEEPAVDTTEEEDGFHVLLSSNFDEDTGDWPSGETDDFAGRVVDGHYELELKSAQQYLTSSPDKALNIADAAISSEVLIEGASGFGGVMLRYSEVDDQRSMYVCWVNNDGKFGCSKAVNNEWTVLVEPTTDAVIKPNDVNRLTLVTIGNQILFDVNDKELASFTDDSLAEGGAGYYAENFDEPLKVKFDNVAIGMPTE
jgi:hypothetical protein